ncbi:tRNA (adenosine(37)-N6)-dimethylallyltransferase MiaA, partial [Candidatus Kapabacteria bacterium]|nr:tRNA (adenosine(37)-N6)-dimethylallyltransferase MiaA [Candidatus Kapabacteria bacterium]
MVNLIVITGPTASGKSDLALQISKEFPIEIISADSRQVFEYLDIGTAKPNQDEQKIVPHHFLDKVKPDEYYSAGLFGEQAYSLVSKIINRNRIPVVVGGSGLYIKALVEGLFDEETSDELFNIKEQLQKLIHQPDSKQELLNELQEVDPISFEKYSDQNNRRIIRAVAYYRVNKIPISQAQIEAQQKRNINPIYFSINHDREILYKRINNRTNQMWENGFQSEVEKILQMGYSPKLNSLDSVGYKECINYLNGDISKEVAISEMQKFTRRFAKRQLTWIRNQTPNIEWIEPNNLD